MTDGHDERDPRDEFDDWPRDAVEPLPPPPGTYERVRRQARRRRLAKAIGVGAVAAVVVAGGVAVPRMIRAGQPEPIMPQVSGSTPVHTPRTPLRATNPPPAHTATPPRPSKGTSGTGEVSPTRSHANPPPPGPGRCHTGDLSVHLTRTDSGAGNRYAGLVLTNTASRTCTLYGYVGVGLLGPGGPMPTNLVRDPGPRRHLTVAPGESAVTSLHWTAIPSVDEGTHCSRSTAIEVTPPDETAQRTTEWPGGEVCGHGRIDTVPLVKGSAPPPIG